MKSVVAFALVAVMVAAVAPVAGDSWSDARSEFVSAKENFLNAYSDWLSARSEYVSARATWVSSKTQATLNNLVDKARTASLKAADMFVADLEMLKARANASRGLSEENRDNIIAELDGYITEIQGYKQAVENTETGLELRQANKAMWQYWLSIRVRIKQITAQILVAGFEGMVERAQAFAGRVEAKIQELKENGEDTTALENWLDNFESTLALAQEKVDNAYAKVEEITDNVTFRQIYGSALYHLRNALVYLRDAFKGLKNIVVQMRSEGHTVTLSGSGTLVAEGSGSFYGEGTGLVKVTAIENSVMVVSSNAHVKTDGVGTVENLENGDVKYSGFGYARVTGSDIRVSITGQNIRLRASGTGTVTLSGTGFYRTFGESEYHSGFWSSAGVSVTLSTGEVQG